jgi:oxalate decarboxylase/phosphoglucose isomerase-like protein (cupin superfamily)
METEGSLLDRVQILEGERHSDERGWLHVALRRHHLPEGAGLGELYIVHSEAPGIRRGDHYHPEANEWFTVIAGSARFELLEPGSGARRDIESSAQPPRTIGVPAGLAHAIVNLGPGPLTVVAWTDQPHSSDDVVPCSTEAR